MLIAAAVGYIVASPKNGSETLCFTLVNGENRYLVRAAGVGLTGVVYDIIRNNYQRVLVVGRGYSFRDQRCGKHHFGIEAVVILPSSEMDIGTVSDLLALVVG